MRQRLFQGAFFFFNDPPTTEIYPLPQPDALPISGRNVRQLTMEPLITFAAEPQDIPAHTLHPVELHAPDTPTSGIDVVEGTLRFRTAGWYEILRSEEHTSESSHSQISYAVFCLKK